ncbi:MULTISPECIES: hypothetical protein [unclassified Nonomuraea]|uniref:hypothetical protein n=1 Tax=unclassified Nonomuraea TaxID=2593643 RepID=UPI001486601E|nr:MULTISPECIES: hypothetical protein [unclassified Nonomuraea]
MPVIAGCGGDGVVDEDGGNGGGGGEGVGVEDPGAGRGAVIGIDPTAGVRQLVRHRDLCTVSVIF